MQEQYKQYTYPLTRIIQGLPTSWDLSITTRRLSGDSADCAITWSPGDQFIAAACRGVEDPITVLDPMTLEQFTILRTPLNFTAHELFFSPDGQMITCFGHSPDILVTFDLQTGGLVSAIPLEQQSHCETFPFHTYSACGTMFACLQSVEGVSTIYTYNVISGTHIGTLSIELSSKNIWAHDKHLRLASVEPEAITIWEVGFTSEHLAVKLESLPIPDNFHLSESYHFLPALHLLTFIVEVDAYIWDVQHSKFLLEFSGELDIAEISLTSDGRFACVIDDLEVYLWRKSSTSYILHKKIMIRADLHNSAIPYLSPDGEFLAIESGATLQVWHTRELITSDDTPAQDFENRILDRKSVV